MSQGPVFIFGAGASRPYGGPLTNEILFRAFSERVVPLDERKEQIQTFRECLMEHFHVPNDGLAKKEEFPSLTMLLSIVDLAIERNRPLPQGPKFPMGMGREELTQARATVEFDPH